MKFLNEFNAFQNKADQPNDFLSFIKDIQALFREEKAGHMECWEYSKPKYKGDKSGGAFYWSQLVENAGAYYLPRGDIECIQAALKTEAFKMRLSSVRTIIELGAGSEVSIAYKTLPFIKTCKNSEAYFACDMALHQAQNACDFLSSSLSIATHAVQRNFLHGAIPVHTGVTSVIVWGGTLYNIQGKLNENAEPKLASTLKRFKSGMKSGDIFVTTFDPTFNPVKVKMAYNELSLKSQCLSILYLLAQTSMVQGNFNPDVWRHEPIWIEEVGQCAHALFPLFKQEFTIAGERFVVPAFKRFISNNSYKFTVQTMEKLFLEAGFKDVCIYQANEMALAYASV